MSPSGSCIWGHHATSCQHADRVLMEVRKPGHPLQSCGHKPSSCTSCGRLAEAFSVGGGGEYMLVNPFLMKVLVYFSPTKFLRLSSFTRRIFNSNDTDASINATKCEIKTHIKFTASVTPELENEDQGYATCWLYVLASGNEEDVWQWKRVIRMSYGMSTMKKINKCHSYLPLVIYLMETIATSILEHRSTNQ